VDNYTVAKAKYEEQYGKGKIGRRLDDCRDRYQKACRCQFSYLQVIIYLRPLDYGFINFIELIPENFIKLTMTTSC
jgi:hypothetical protein